MIQEIAKESVSLAKYVLMTQAVQTESGAPGVQTSVLMDGFSAMVQMTPEQARLLGFALFAMATLAEAG